MPEVCGTAEALLTTQIEKALRRNRAVPAGCADRSKDAQRVSRLLCDQLDELVGGKLRSERRSE